MIIEAYYAGHTDHPVIVTTPAELAAVLDDIAALDGPHIVQLWVDCDKMKSDLMVGLHGDRGTLRYADVHSVFYSAGGSFPLPEWGEVMYYLATAEHEYPDDAEISEKDVREAALAFLMSDGERPMGVKWTQE